MSTRLIQPIILAEWSKSAYIPADIIRAMPSVTPHNLRRYLAGDESVRLSEANLDQLLGIIRAGPKKRRERRVV
jgi:hypothetical protein